MPVPLTMTACRAVWPHWSDAAGQKHGSPNACGQITSDFEQAMTHGRTIRRVHLSGFKILRMGQAEVMGKLARRSTILTAALAPIAAASLVIPAAGSAQPLDCQNGEWWDPVANVCQPPVAPVPVGCQNGDWWDPVGNVCRPPLAPFPPNCGDGQYWNPVSNACRPLGQV